MAATWIFIEARAAGAWVLDARDRWAFAEGHLKGAWNIEAGKCHEQNAKLKAAHEAKLEKCTTEEHQGSEGKLPLPPQRVNYKTFLRIILRHLPEQGLPTLNKSEKEKEGPYY